MVDDFLNDDAAIAAYQFAEKRFGMLREPQHERKIFKTLPLGVFQQTVSSWTGFGIGLIAALTFTSCATVLRPDARLRETAGLVEEVKIFGRSLGIEPTPALSRTTQNGPALSMLWLWMQHIGTLAVHGPVDVRMAIGFDLESERLKIEQVYRVDGYSVYYRQGNEFSDSRAVATVGFADEPIVRRVKVILHEDLHGDANFALPWEIEEGIVTPLGSLAAIEYFRYKSDEKNWKNAIASVSEERKVARELSVVVDEAEKIFAAENAEAAKQKILAVLPSFPAYYRQFERQIRGQHASTVLEAKLSHDLAYYRYFDRIATLAEIAPNLKTLINDLKQLPHDATLATAEQFLRELNSRYRSVPK
jgi:hypothetical protein